MRLRQDFSLYKRIMRSGKVVYYFQMYDEDGRRLPGKSTGKANKTAATLYCQQLIREDRLNRQDINNKRPFFKDFAKGFWEYESSEYIASRSGRRDITRSYAASGEMNVRNYILPYFKNMRLDTIDDVKIDLWLTWLRKRGLKNTSAMTAFRILSVMLTWAQKKKFIRFNPCRLVVPLKNDSAGIEILERREVLKLFPVKWEKVWDKYVCYVVNKMGAHTGMRIGEILGLRAECVFNGFIAVVKQYGNFGYTDVKTKRAHLITIPKELEKDLRALIKLNGKEGYLFTMNPQKKIPVSRATVYNALYKALGKIGIDEDERKRRHLVMHGWRHFLNTYLQTEKVPEYQVMETTGHLTKEMKERYSHFNPLQFKEVMQAQEALLARGKKPKKEPSKQEKETARRLANVIEGGFPKQLPNRERAV
jgi:integrase